MPGETSCLLCRRRFAPLRGGTLRYCRTCQGRVDREIAAVHRAKCDKCGARFTTTNRSVRYCSDRCRPRKHAARLPPYDGTSECRTCGKSFRTPSRAFRYCSDRCRKKGQVLRAWSPRRPRRAASAEAAAGPAGCRMCGGDLPAGLPGTPRVYCSAACRAEGERAYGREYKRRYLADPEKRAVHDARLRASAARRRAAARAARAEVRTACKECGIEFAPASRAVRYCSDPCRKKGYERGWRESDRRRRERGRAPAKCRVCSAEFMPGQGGGRLMAYCSAECKAEGRRAYFRERRQRLRSGGGRSGGGR